MITINMIRKGYNSGLVNLIESPNKDGVVCRIGANWFYFGGLQATECSVKDYIETVQKEIIIKEIYEVLEDFRLIEEFEEEYLYYKYYLVEHGITRFPL